MTNTATATLDVDPSIAGPLNVPPRVGAFQIIRELGRGGSGVVFEARNLETAAIVALKFLRSPEPSRVARFKEEVRRVASLRHPNLLVPYELVNSHGFWFFSMQRIYGADLVSFVRDAATSTEGLERAHAVFAQLASAVAALHADGLLHLDLKPGNVLIAEDGQVFVLDFGVSRQLNTESEPTPSGLAARAGTPDYWAPEQASSGHPIPESDWYAVGVMLFESLTGRLPRSGERPSDVRPGLPLHLDDACAELLSHDPGARMRGAERLRAHADPRAASSKSTELMGRDAELEILQTVFATVRAGSPALVLMHGAPGAGKTALARHFLLRLRRAPQQPLILSGRCYERENVPYKGFDTVIDALSTHLFSRSATPRPAVLDAANRAAELFPILLGPISERIARKTSELSDLRRHAVEGVRDLLVHLASEQAVIVFLDDVQWADHDTISLLNDVFGGMKNAAVLLLLTSRDDGRSAADLLKPWQPLALAAPCTSVAVPPLSPTLAAELASNLAGDSDRGQEIARAADGNPFLIEELALRAAAHVSGPDLWADLVTERMHVLSEDARRALKLTALMGRPIEENVVLDVLGAVDREQLWAELRRHALLRTRANGSRVVLEAWHDRVQQAVRTSLPNEEIRNLHAGLAQALERHEGPPAELAYHFEESDEPARALPYYKVAADDAWRVLAFDRAAQLYGSALRLEPTGSELRGELTFRLAESLFNVGRGGEAATRFLEAARLRSGLSARQARVRATEAYLLAGRIDEGLDLSRELTSSTPHAPSVAVPAGLSAAGQIVSVLVRGVEPRRTAASDPELEVASDLYWTLAKGFIYVMPVEATNFLLRSLRLALRAGDRARAGRSLGLLGGGMFMQIPVLANTGARYLAQATAIGRETNDAYLSAMSEVWGAFSEVYPGRFRAMFEGSQRGVQLLKERCVGVAWEEAIADGLSAWALQFMGKLSECEKYSLNALQTARGRGDLYSEILFSQYLAYAELAAGRAAQARERVESTSERWTKRSYTIPHFYAMFLSSVADLLDLDPGRALARFVADRPAFLKAGGLRTPMSRIDFNALEARIHLSVDDEAAKKARLRPLSQLVKAFAGEKRSDCAGHAAFVRAAMSARAGQERVAREHWRACEQAYSQADMALHAACARLRRLELDSDQSQIAETRERISACGVADPSAWAAALLPAGRAHARR
ncbi:MAG TPA: AAA family ATPase [Polyangiaceae bacterium]|nr:AAA family ATPase [Polyangiaceae bacterium]